MLETPDRITYIKIPRWFKNIRDKCICFSPYEIRQYTGYTTKITKIKTGFFFYNTYRIESSVSKTMEWIAFFVRLGIPVKIIDISKI